MQIKKFTLHEGIIWHDGEIHKKGKLIKRL